MKKVILAIALLSAGMPAFAATAYFTGRSEITQTVTYKSGWNCEYRYAGRTFWMTFAGSCPATVEIQ